MKSIYNIIISASLAATVLSSCGDSLKPDFSGGRNFWNGNIGAVTRNPSEDTRRTLLVYSAGFNNLSNALRDDIDDIFESYLPEGYGYSDNLLVFAHHSKSGYSTDIPPCLIRLYINHDGQAVRDTVHTWPSGTRAVDPETLADVLSYVKENFPSKEYGMIFSSHASGWLPPGYSLYTSPSYSAPEASASSGSIAAKTAGKPERSIGQDAGNNAEMDVREFAKAIPFKLSYLIFDACLTGGVEVAYELKDKCGYLVFSSEEILSDGMVYTNITSRLLEETPSNLIGVAEDYFNHYNSQSGQYRSALISVVDCGMLEPLAEACEKIFSGHTGQLPGIDHTKVQQLNYTHTDRYGNAYPCYFYDLRDIVSQAASEAELMEVDEALAGCVLYKANTEYFFDSKIDTFCGLSMYLPSALKAGSTRDYLNDYYKGYKWNQATHWIPDIDIY